MRIGLGLGIGIGMFRAVMSAVQPTLTLSISPTNPVAGQTVTITGIVGGFPVPSDFLAIGATIDGATVTLSGTGLTRTFTATAGVATISASVSNLFGVAVEIASISIAPSSSLTIPISSGAWTAAEAAADIDTRKSYVVVNIAFQGDTQIGVYRGTTAPDPVTGLTQLFMLSWDGTKYVGTSGGQNARGTAAYHRVARVLANGTREWITDVGDVKTFTASDVPGAPVFTHTPTSAGASTLTFTAPVWNSRTGTGGEYQINGGAWVPFTGTSTLALTGLSGVGDNVGVRWINANVDATHPAPIAVQNVVSGSTPGVTAHASLSGRTVTITVDATTGTPSPGVAISVLTLDGANVIGAATGTGPWSYVAASASSDMVLAWELLATSTAGSARASGTITIPADVAVGAITLSMASARIGQPITVSTTLNADLYAFYAMFKDALDDDETGATNQTNGWRLLSGQKAQTGLIASELACGRQVCILAVHQDTGEKIYSNAIGPLGYEAALADNGTTIRQVADEAAFNALDLTTGGGITTVLLASGRTWSQSAITTKLTNLNRSALALSIRSSDPANPIRIDSTLGSLSLNGTNNVKLWRIYSDFRTYAPGAPVAFSMIDTAVDCGFTACVHVGPKMSDDLLLGVDLTSAWLNYGAKAFDLNSATRPVVLGNLVKWCWCPYQFNGSKGARIESNFVRGFWMDGARGGSSGIAVGFNYTAPGNKMLENVHEMCIGYSEEAAVATGAANNNPHPDGLWQTFAGAHHNNEAVGNILVPGPYRGMIDHPTFAMRPEVHGILNNGYCYSPFYAGNVLYGTGATGINVGTTGGDAIFVKNTVLNTSGQASGMNFSTGGSATSGIVIAEDNVTSGLVSAPDTLLDGPETMITGNNFTSVNSSAGTVVRWGIGAPKDAIEALRWGRAVALSGAVGAVTPDGYLRLTKSSRPAIPSIGTPTAVAGGILVDLTPNGLGGGAVVEYLGRARPVGATYWLRPRTPFRAASGNSFQIGGASFPLGNTAHEFQVMIKTTTGYSQWSPIFTATPLVAASATPPTVTLVSEGSLTNTSTGNNKTIDFWLSAGLADTTRDHVVLGFMKQTGSGIRSISTVPMIWTTQANGAGSAIPIERLNNSVAGTNRRIALAAKGRPDADARGARLQLSGSGNFSGYAGMALFKLPAAYDPISSVITPSSGIGALGTHTVTTNVPSGSKLLCYAYGENGAPMTWTGATEIAARTDDGLDATDPLFNYSVATQNVSVGGPVTVSIANANGLIVVAVPAQAASAPTTTVAFTASPTANAGELSLNVTNAFTVNDAELCVQFGSGTIYTLAAPAATGVYLIDAGEGVVAGTTQSVKLFARNSYGSGPVTTVSATSNVGPTTTVAFTASATANSGELSLNVTNSFVAADAQLCGRVDSGATFVLATPASSGTYLINATQGVIPGVAQTITLFARNAYGDGPVTTAVQTSATGAFPTFRQSGANYTGTSDSTTHNVTAYASRVVGDTLIAQIGVDGNPTLTLPGWTLLVGGNVGIDNGMHVYTRTADGTSADNIALTLSAAETCAIKTWCCTGTKTVVASSLVAVNGTGQSASCPSLSLGSSRKARWLALVEHSGANTAVSGGSAPTSYTYDGTVASTGTNSTHVRVHAAYRDLETAATTPGAYSQTVTSPATVTLAIY